MDTSNHRMTKIYEIQNHISIQQALLRFGFLFPDLQQRIGSIDEFAAKLSRNAIVSILESNGEAVGFVAFYANDLKTKTCFITLIGVLPEFQRMRYGIKLLNHCIAKASGLGMMSIQLEVNKKKTAAFSFYMKNGFSKTEKETDISIFLERKI